MASKDPYKTPTIGSVFGQPTRTRVSKEALGGPKESQSFAERRAKGRTMISTWVPNEVHDQLKALTEALQFKTDKDTLVYLISKGYKENVGG